MTETPYVFHAGERAVQDRAGISAEWRSRAARAIRPEMLPQHQAFFENLPLVFLGLKDGFGRPWATVHLLPTRARASETTLTLPGLPVLAEQLGLDLCPGAKVATLGLEFETRRRNRMNGAIASATKSGLTVAVEQSFGNCPKYIHPRAINLPARSGPSALGERVTIDDPTTHAIISAADTFFIATSGDGGADVSHRGGTPGVLQIGKDGTLSFPDFAGNRFFNTLGNIETTGRAGLFIPDFTTGDAVLLTGHARIDWAPERAARIDGAERVIDLHPAAIWRVSGVL
ncbi:pyridoxamine 5'-phosphate oxidase family protein [Shimia aestuarii]|uniref:pyridoxamine 5'-phosphate oxidase family protein n=1 Tax=Shimia aestuarii TaxID=254406 RepID=UPI001FB52352|nr:pyridoxamine 5'-phosphate oxidase family protein [Shimia aestuarii]